jgi:hypothetical protein
MRKIKCAPGQSIFDATLEGYGDMNGLAMLLKDNISIIENASNLDNLILMLRDTYTDKSNVENLFSKRKPTSI